MADQERKTLAEPVAGAPTACSFCGAPTTTSPFRAVAKDLSAAMCYACITRFSISHRLTRISNSYNDESIWPALRLDMERAVSWLRPGARRAVVELGLHLARRSAAILAGMRVNGGGTCPKSGADLSHPRLALIGEGARHLGPAAEAISTLCGFVSMQTTIAEGMADVELLFQACGYEHLAFEHAVLFVSDGYTPVDNDCAVICAVENDDALPSGTRCWRIDGCDPTELS